MLAATPPEGPHRRPPPRDPDDALLGALDAAELYDIHKGLDWCERELRALGPLPSARRRQVAALRRRWAHRWRAATGRPAVSLLSYRAWRLAAVLAAAVAILGTSLGSEEPGRRAPVAVVASPEPTATYTPEPVVRDRPMPPDPMPGGRPGPQVTDAVAQARALRLARRLERCARPAGFDFETCFRVTPRDGRYVEITAYSKVSYLISSMSHSGSTFTLARRMMGDTERYCYNPVPSRCRPDRRW